MKFNILLEKIKNPLRKQALAGTETYKTIADKNVPQWKNYILYGIPDTEEDKKIKEKYYQLKAKFSQRAEEWLNKKAQEYHASLLKLKLNSTDIKLFDYQGIQVFATKEVIDNFKEGSYYLRLLKHSVGKMVQDTKELIPNRKPRIVVVDKYTNKNFDSTTAGLYHGRIIYVDQNYVDDYTVLVHELAHFIVDLIPAQTEPLLDKAYRNMLDLYYKRAKVKKIKLQPSPERTPEENEASERMRQKISVKLGFPQYGLMNRDEFFAVLIENWKTLPTNPMTYKFKQLVKNILTRL